MAGAPLLSRDRSAVRVATADVLRPLPWASYLVVALLALAMTLTGLTTASAGTEAATSSAPQVRSLFVNATVDPHDREIVRVNGTFKCSGPSAQMPLWVSVKQGGPDPTAEGSSSTVKAWYDTNVSGDVRIGCDGTWHTRTVRLERAATDFTGRALGHLRNGGAWMQFCLVTPDGIVASTSRWVNVKGA